MNGIFQLTFWIGNVIISIVVTAHVINGPQWRNGRRNGLKIRRPQKRVGSSPTCGIYLILKNKTASLIEWCCFFLLIFIKAVNSPISLKLFQEAVYYHGFCFCFGHTEGHKLDYLFARDFSDCRLVDE